MMDLCLPVWAGDFGLTLCLDSGDVCVTVFDDSCERVRRLRRAVTCEGG